MTDEPAIPAGGGPDDPHGEESQFTVMDLLAGLDVGVHQQSVTPIEQLSTKDKFPDLTAQREELKLKRLRERVKQLEQDTKLRGPYAWTILIATGVQIVVADVVFVLYAIKGVHWAIPPAAISAWLGAVVIQVIGVVLVVTRYLFPGKGSQDSED